MDCLLLLDVAEVWEPCHTYICHLAIPVFVMMEDHSWGFVRRCDCAISATVSNDAASMLQQLVPFWVAERPRTALRGVADTYRNTSL